MIRASLYIVACSARNRTRVRLRRLRQPRYLLGGIVGVVYIYLTVFARWRSRAGRSRPQTAPREQALATLAAAGPSFAAIALTALAAVAWLLPFDSGLIEFSEAEVAFLFPAPVSRRELLLHRLMRSQIGLLVGAIVPAILYPGASGLARVRWALGMWVLLVTAKVYFTGVTLTRRRIAARAADVYAWLPIAISLFAAGTVAAIGARILYQAPAANLRDLWMRLADIGKIPAARVVLAPALIVARPLFPSSSLGYAGAMAGAMVALAAATVWIIRADAALYEVSGDSPIAAGGEVAPRRRTLSARNVPWTLAPVGRTDLALAWRASVDTIRSAGGIGSIRPFAVLLSLSVAVAIATRQRGIAQLIALIATVGAGSAVVLGPQMMRTDLRQDLRNIDLLRTWPVRPADLIRGELIWPAAVLSALAWVALAVALAASGRAFVQMTLAWRLGLALGAALVAPAAIAAQLTIHNAAALAFPAWIATGSQRPRGLDAMGQRLIMLAATMALLAIMLLPGALAGGAIWLAFRRVLGAGILPPAAGVAAAVVFLEVLIATEALGPMYERVDLSEIERSET